MAVFEESRYVADPRRSTSGLARRVTGLLASIAEWNDARSTRKALAGLSDRQLEDIGLARGDIDQL